MSDVISSSDDRNDNDLVVPNTGSSEPDDGSNPSDETGYKRYTIRRQFGRYRILECLGRGGMGMVFKALDTGLDRLVALKVPFLGKDDADTKERFYREARAAAALHHANICPVFDVGEIGGVPYLTMAFIDGRSLAYALAAGQSFTPLQAALLVRKLALAMQEAHAHGVIHRDLKPANVIVRPNGEPMVMDFGLARRRDDTKSRGLTKKGDVLGTVDYMSPEQVEGDAATVGPEADVYALGVMLYEMLAGRRPFGGGTAAVLAATLVTPPPRPSELRPGVPPRLEEICLTALNKKPADRFPSMAKFAAALAEFLRAPQLGPSPAPAAKSPDPLPRETPPAIKPEADDPNALSRARFSPSGLKSARKRSRSVTRRKARAKHRSYLPMILGVTALAVVVVSGLAVAAIGLWPRGTKPAPAPPAVAQNPPPAAPAIPAPPAAPQASAAPAPAPPPPTAPEPRELGLALNPQPESVTLEVGKTQVVTVRVARQDYQGTISLRWDGPKNVQVSPAGPLTLQPGQSEATLNLSVSAEIDVANPPLKITATPAQQTDRGSATATVAIGFRAGPCVRVIDVGAVDALAFAPDASTVLTGGAVTPPAIANPNSDRNSIQVWNLERGTPISHLRGHADRVSGIAVAANGKTALSVGADDTIAVWDLAQGHRKQQSAKAQGTQILAAAVSPDGKRGLVVYSGAIARVNLDTLQPAGPPWKTTALAGDGAPDAIRTAAISPDRKALAGGMDGKLFVLDLNEKGKPAPPKPLSGHTEAVLCAAFGPAGKTAATAGGGIWRSGTLHRGVDNAVRLWDATTLTIKWTSDSFSDPVVSLAFSADGRLLAAGAADGEVRVWAVEDGKLVASLKGHTGRVLGLLFAPGEKTLWSGSADQTVRAWRLP